jgi:PAS domain S-box-containing protein
MNILIQRFSVITGFSLLIFLLIGNTVVTRRQLAAQVQNQVWVNHTLQVRFELAQIELLLADAETGQRGYLYTGDPKYLAPYNDAVATLESHLQHLAQLTAENPHQQQHIGTLRELANLKLQELTQTISLVRAGKSDDARSIVLSDRGLMLMNDFRHEIDQMQQEEITLGATRDAAYQRSLNVLIACIYLATAVAAAGLVVLAYFILRERSARERHARELQEREEWFRVTLTSIGDAVIATDGNGVVTFLNSTAEALTGVPVVAARGKKIEEVFPIFNEVTGNVTENPVVKVMSLGKVVGLANHTVLRHRDGHLIPIEDSAAPIRDDHGAIIGVVLVFHDVTSERKSQEVLRKTEKLAAAARLSATVAHEINNPLEAVVNLVFLAKASPDATPSLRQHLAMAEQELERVAHLTRQTLGFYHDSNEPELVEIGSVVESVLRLYSNKIAAKNIRIQLHVDNCPPILGVAGEMRQVVSNLLSNAMDAVSVGGQITIRCARFQTHEGIAAELIIEDDGPGVEAELIERIFDPFFTTKKDVGTGLGLWVTREIVDRHGGKIELRSPASIHLSQGGAAFVVHLPASADGEASPLPSRKPATGSDSTPPSTS